MVCADAVSHRYVQSRARGRLWPAWPLTFALAVTSLMILPLSTAARADAPISYEDYRALIARARQDVRAAGLQSPQECAATLDRIASELAGVTAVEMPDGTIMPFEFCCGLEEALRADPCDAARAEAFLRALCPGCDSRTEAIGLPDRPAGGETGTTDATQPGGADGNDVRPGAGGQPGAADGEGSFEEREEQGGAGCEDAEMAPPSSSPAILLGFLLGAVAVLLAILAAVLLGRQRPKPSREPGRDASIEDVTASAEAMKRAQQLAASSDYRAAIRCLLLAALLALDERRLLRFENALTNRELLERAAKSPPLAEALGPVIAAFDRVWYGFDSLPPAEYDALAERVRALSRL